MTYRATGYDPYEYFFASKYLQGGRTVFALDFSVRELVTFLPKPDPDRPLDAHSTQRKIVAGHARDFGAYVKDDPAWVSPALLLRGPAIFRFEPIEELESGTTQFGQLGIPKDSRAEIEIVDGQHRTLGFHLAWEQLNAEIQNARSSVARAEQQGDPSVAHHHRVTLDAKLARRDTLASERVSVQIVVVETPEVARRIFVDINDNAKGITGAVKTRFDDRKVVSRALNKVIVDNPLIAGRVDLEQDRVSGASPYLLGAKHVHDILRALTVGGNGRVSKRVEDETHEDTVVQSFGAFTGALTSAFSEMDQVQRGDLTPSELRAKSLIGSNVTLRALAAAWYDLRLAGWTPQAITSAWTGFAQHSWAPVFPSMQDSWFATGLFAPRLEGSSSPTSRAQDFKTLKDFLVSQTRGGDGSGWYRATEADERLVSFGD